FDPQRSLPLHVCDIVPWIGIFALLRPRPWSLSITYFWGIGLSIFAFLIPIVSEPPTELAFWVFWLAHWQIVATAAYLVWAQDYTPSWHDWRYACVFTGIYMLLAVPVNLWLGSDYGYVGKEGIAAVVAPWPQRVPLLWVVECTIFALFLMPFLRRPQAPTAS
ncbi:MAG: TIGR02206 family membrane protein, partial [Pseudomonadota bacterium]